MTINAPMRREMSPITSNSQALCITGMHRSATSLAASWLQACGLAVDDGRVLGPRTGNPKGHFEDEDFMALQVRLIKSRVPRSGGWKVANPLRIVPDSIFEESARELIRERAEKFAFWGWKDPRSSLLLHHWKRLIPGMKAILLWRPCAEVAGSLLDRARADGDRDVTTWEAVSTWRAYNQSIISYKRAFPGEAILVSAKTLVEKDAGVMEKIRSQLGLDLNYAPLADIYDPKLLKSRPPGWWMKILCASSGTEKIERELASLSDI